MELSKPTPPKKDNYSVDYSELLETLAPGEFCQNVSFHFNGLKECFFV